MNKILNILSWFKRKGISSSVAAVLIATISVTLIGTTYLFSKGLMEGTTAEIFELIDIFQNKVIIRNIGTQEIKEIKTFIEGKEVENTLDKPIQPGSVGTITLILTDIPAGKHELILMTKSMSQRLIWEFVYSETTTTIGELVGNTFGQTFTVKSSELNVGIESTSQFSQPCESTGYCICSHSSMACYSGTWDCINNYCGYQCPAFIPPHMHEELSLRNCGVSRSADCCKSTSVPCPA